MRLHRLTIEGFGPYADRQQVDFDELTDAGVFLLTGPTGAGKTSVLDAVCFALYGVVPGDREVRGLRSAHATPEVPTQVELELTLCGRRLRIVRWPEWERPKRRGDGTTTERAGARLLEIDADGSERLLSARVQEVGHELGPLLGMTSEQFMQVVLLPQGGFSTFLKADSDQRRDVLERLFATQRFARIEGWVHERAGTLRRRSEQGRAELLELLTATAHRAGRPRPDAVDELESLTTWRQEVLEEARAAVETAALAEHDSRERCQEAHDTERAADRRRTLLHRRARAEAELHELAQTEDEALQARQRLLDHRRAGTVAPLLGPLAEAEASVSAAARLADLTAGRLPEALVRSACEHAVAELQRRVGELKGLAPLVARMDDARRRLTALHDDLAAASHELAERTADAEKLPALRSELAARLEEARAVAAGREVCEDRAEAATRCRRAAEALPAAAQMLDDVIAEAHRAHEEYNVAREAHLDLVDRRLRGMAAELAGVLEDGSACQVCGSTDHPAPASPSPDAVTRQQQEAAQARTDEARGRHERLQQDLAEARQHHGGLQQASLGLDPAEALRAEQAALHQLEQAAAATVCEAELAEQLQALDVQVSEAGRVTATAREERDRLAREVAVAEGLVVETEPQVRAVLGAEPSLDAALDEAQARLTLLEERAKALTALDEARAALDTWQLRAGRALDEAGFDDAAQARAALLTETDETVLEALVAQRREARAQAEGVLSDPDVRAAADTLAADTDPDGDLHAAQRLAQDASAALQEAVSTLRSAEQGLAALVALDDQVATALAAWLPARDEHALAESMSRLVRGMGSDNQLQMRLSSYVVATRLDQVLEAADERLQQMRDNRYTLHRSARARAGRRSGLDIDVLDDWTGEVRPPSSLSGGETFKLSLALALGLADVIKQESGGLEIETLFIDEGFGMLDPDTLDEVMDCVDDLRSGGRAVGVVSHVSELRSRVGTQLVVTPSPEGSRLSLTTTTP